MTNADGTFAESRVPDSRGVEVPNAPDAPEGRDDNDAVDESPGLPSSPPLGREGLDPMNLLRDTEKATSAS
jgi:hypothetical protein